MIHLFLYCNSGFESESKEPSFFVFSRSAPRFRLLLRRLTSFPPDDVD